MTLHKELRAACADSEKESLPTKTLIELLQQLSALRRDDHEAAQLRMAVERHGKWREEKEKLEEEQKRTELFTVLFEAERKQMMVDHFSRGDPGCAEKLRRMVETHREPQRFPFAGRGTSADQGKSKSI